VLTCGADGKIQGFDPFRVGLAFGAFASNVTFGDGIHPYIERESASASFEWHPNLDTTLSWGAGASLGGRMIFDDVHETIGAGWLVTFAYTRRLMTGLGSKPFMLMSFSAGVSEASTYPTTPAPNPGTEPLWAIDVRAGLVVGKTFWRTLSPYGAARVYGGPIIWKYAGQTRTGTDEGHFQIAAGMVASLPKGFDLFGEVAPIFERGVTVGVGKSF
jgi:hypothetical protein